MLQICSTARTHPVIANHGCQPELESSEALNDGIRGSVPGDFHRDGHFVTTMSGGQHPKSLAPLFMAGHGQIHDHDLPTSMDRKPPAGQGGQRIVSYHSARAQRPPAISTAQQHPTGRADFAAPPKLHRIQARPVPR